MMQMKTSGTEFRQYGSVYDQPLNLRDKGKISRELNLAAEHSVSWLYCFECEIYLEMQDGMADLIVGEKAVAGELHSFAVHRMVRLKPGVYFNLVAVTSRITCRLITQEDYKYTLEYLKPPYIFERVLPYIRITEILGYYYSVRGSGYHFKGEAHPYFELTYVERGILDTEVEGKTHTLREKELMIYGSGQFHTQSVSEADSCAYVTVIFAMEFPEDDRKKGQGMLLNRTFRPGKKVQALLKTFISESSSQLPYMHSLLLCILQEIIIRLLQSEFTGMPEKHHAMGVRRNYEDEMLVKILDYIEENICEPLTIAELCGKFSLSRSSLQLLFKENIEVTPKKYICDRKLERSKQLILENRYTISEVALMLGFSSIHYFSRAFAQKYDVPPSEYAKIV